MLTKNKESIKILNESNLDTSRPSKGFQNVPTKSKESIKIMKLSNLEGGVWDTSKN